MKQATTLVNRLAQLIDSRDRGEFHRSEVSTNCLCHEYNSPFRQSQVITANYMALTAISFAVTLNG